MIVTCLIPDLETSMQA